MTDDPIREYLAELGKELGRFARHRRRTLAEVEDHLREAARSLEAGGIEPLAAQRVAVAAFGSPRQVAQFRVRHRTLTRGMLMAIGAGVVVIAASAAGFGWIGNPSAHHVSATRMTPKSTAISDPTGGVGAVALVRSIESGLSTGGIVRVRFGPPPGVYLRQTSKPWMYVRLTQVDAAGGVKPEWEAGLLAAAYYTQAPSHGLPVEGGMYVYRGQGTLAALRSGQGDANGGPIGVDNVVPVGATTPVRFDPTTADAADLRRSLTHSIQSVGLTTRSIRFEHVDGYLVPVVVTETPDPATFIRRDPPFSAVLGREPNGYEGIYFQLDYPDGQPALIRAFASRTASGVSYTKPSLNPDPTP
jgi:hypothetical protein